MSVCKLVVYHHHHHPLTLNLKNPNYLGSTLQYPVIKCSSNSTNVSSIKPYIQSQWKLILQGWGFSAVSVFSLSKIVHKAASLSSILSDVDAIKYDAALISGFFALRLLSTYLQHAFLWQAAFNCSYEIRTHVFQRVLDCDLGFFHASDAVSPSDIAHRFTSEAHLVADTVFALLNTIVPSTLQLSAMAAQMLAISPALSITSAFVFLSKHLTQIIDPIHSFSL